MTIDIDAIERLALAATPGPWRGDRIDGTVKYDIVAGDYPNGECTVVCHGDNGNACDGGYGFTSAENEDYVLAANPAAILALIAEVRALREAAQGVLDWTEIKHRPPVPESFPCGEMAGVRVHALVKLHQVVDAARAKEKA